MRCLAYDGAFAAWDADRPTRAEVEATRCAAVPTVGAHPAMSRAADDHGSLLRCCAILGVTRIEADHVLAPHHELRVPARREPNPHVDDSRRGRPSGDSPGQATMPAPSHAHPIAWTHDHRWASVVCAAPAPLADSAARWTRFSGDDRASY
jgi:hypothetical protein